ncbi:hypothetical protein WG68_02305 [Arsukibacterium ikkense]|uniref:Urease accessory protein UreH-like transmembrane domain-containing protein n=1 Tax=Arsukibacterium ikkense TaxID=336831 RepID=A0A0M2V864_9GAMM|nr:sulfite exporter TauE/SafE family protein [Arsukibacterium ikkense]KKO46801.1 hypothetical protein WG68_02305 [Arsukibacterium ikkense]
MTHEVALLFGSAFVIGLLGSAHCIGMCGGLSSALSMGLKPQKPAEKVWFLNLLNLGRIFSYVLAGVMVGSVGYFAQDLGAGKLLRLFAGILMILMGLYIAGLSKVLVHIERAGAKVFSFIQPLSRAFYPINNSRKAFIVGFFWGWLPCGLVYSTLVWSAAQGSVIISPLLMLAFGMGTIPALLLTGSLSVKFQSVIKNSNFRLLSGLAVLIMGIWTIPGPHKSWLM